MLMTYNAVEPLGALEAAGWSERNFSANLRYRRLALEWSQQRLADTMSAEGHDMHQTTIARIEKGKGERRVTIDEAITFCRLLDVPLVDMLVSPEAARNERVRELEAELEAIARESVRMAGRYNLVKKHLAAERESARG